MFQRWLGKGIDDKILDFEQALEKIRELKDKGAQPVELSTQAGNLKRIKHEHPGFSSIFDILGSHFAPYQMEHDKRLKGETTVRYRIRDYVSYEQHRFDFTLYIDNYTEQGVRHRVGYLKLFYKKLT